MLQLWFRFTARDTTAAQRTPRERRHFQRHALIECSIADETLTSNSSARFQAFINRIQLFQTDFDLIAHQGRFQIGLQSAHLFGKIIRDADLTHFSAFHCGIEYSCGFARVCERIGAMHLINVDHIDVHATQTALDARAEILFGRVINAAAYGAFGGDANRVARFGKGGQTFGENCFATSASVNIGVVV